jgi:dihydropteroate synthase
MAGERAGRRAGAPVDAVAHLLSESLALAAAAGIPADAIVVDPGIGFFRRAGLPWHEWDCAVLARLERLRALGRPICVGLSRKSFIGALTGEPDPAGRLPGSLAATALAVLGGAAVIRTHDVAETRQAVQVAQAVRRARCAPETPGDDPPPGAR